ncbi:MAG: hypothetical protein ABR928_07580 [Terracidiphilus sp.]|jgi:hypothetical protein
MSMGCGAAFGVALVMGAWSCAAQKAPVSTDQLPQAPQPQLALSAEGTPPVISSRMMPGLRSAAAFKPAHSAANLHIIDGQFLMFNGLHLGMAILDEQMTQRCIASHQCREGNPLMPSSQAGQLTVDLALVSYGAGLSYRLKKHKSRWWWLAPASGIASHTAGAATGMLH